MKNENHIEYEFYDDLQKNVYFEKYALTDEKGEYLETNPNESLLRCAKEFARIEKKKYKKTKISPLTEEEIMDLFRDFKYIIPQGRPLFGLGNPRIVSLANCFVLPSPVDSYGGIYKVCEMGTQVNKRGGGFGVDFSLLRPKGFAVSNAAKTTTGVVSFMQRFSDSVKEVCQEGRRGAALISIDVTHYDVEDFITSKQKSDKINSVNISVKVTDAFMQAVEKDENYTQRFELQLDNGKVEIHEREVSAKKIFDLLVENAWKSAEPGMMYWDSVLRRTPSECYKDKGFKTITSNPCFSGDTIVATLNEKEGITFKKLYNKYKDEEFNVFSANNTLQNGEIKLQIKKARVIYSGKQEVYKINFENSIGRPIEQYIKCTKDHKFAVLKDGKIKYKKAHLLNEKDVLINFSIINEKDNTQYSFEGDYYCFDEKNNIEHDNFCEKQLAFRYNKIDSIEYVGIEDVYDLQVYDNHNFVVYNHIINEKGYYHRKGILVKNCGEIFMSEYSSCILMLLNLYSFVDNPFLPNAVFNFNKFEKYTKIAQRLIDDLIDLEIEKVEQIIDKVNNDKPGKQHNTNQVELEYWQNVKNALINGRRTGLGTLALADMFAALGVKYGSEESKEITDKVFKTFRNAAYESSIEMAEHLGAFPIFDYELEKDNEYLLDLYKDRPDLLERTKKFGRRNISLLTQSPSGSISIIAGTTSGCEPLFQKSYKRKKKSATDANKWEEYDVIHPKLKEFTEIIGKTIDESPYNEYHEVDWKDSVDIQSIIQKYIDHSISKTINLPKGTTGKSSILMVLNFVIYGNITTLKK